MKLLKQTIRHFLADECPRMAAALAYYTIVALPAVIILVLMVTGPFVDQADVRAQLFAQAQAIIGTEAAEPIREILVNPAGPGDGGPLGVIFGVAALLFAATGAFGQLQGALNRAWEVAPDPDKGIRGFLAKRGLSFLMILGIALLLLLSTLVASLVTGFGHLLVSVLPPWLGTILLRVLTLVVTFAVVTALFAVIFDVLPDAEVAWRDAWFGAAATGALFILGNFVIGFYLSKSDPASAFGAAGSLVLLLVWVYYSSMIVFLGAELTQVVAAHRGREIRPATGAVRVVTEHRVRPDVAAGGTRAHTPGT